MIIVPDRVLENEKGLREAFLLPQAQQSSGAGERNDANGHGVLLKLIDFAHAHIHRQRIELYLRFSESSQNLSVITLCDVGSFL